MWTVFALAVTTGFNSATLKLFSEIVPGYQPPQTSKTFIREYFLGAATADQILGNAIQVFLLVIPRLEFGMFIPKGESMTVCLLGEEIDNEMVQQFLASPDVRRCPADAQAPLPGSGRCHHERTSSFRCLVHLAALNCPAACWAVVISVVYNGRNAQRSPFCERFPCPTFTSTATTATTT